jgi:hypothetical protein
MIDNNKQIAESQMVPKLVTVRYVDRKAQLVNLKRSQGCSYPDQGISTAIDGMMAAIDCVLLAADDCVLLAAVDGVLLAAVDHDMLAMTDDGISTAIASSRNCGARFLGSTL